MTEKRVKILKIVIIAIFVILAIWLFGFKITFLKMDVSNSEQYMVKYRGKTYYGYEEYIWRIEDEKFIGFAHGLENVAYKSSGNDNKKFISVWKPLHVHLRGYGTFVREDIELNEPSSKNISRVLLNGDIEVDEYIKEELLSTLDLYNLGEVIGISENDANVMYEDVDIVAYLRYFHSNYNIYCWGYLYLIDDNYFIHIQKGLDGPIEYIPISYELGEMIEHKR